MADLLKSELPWEIERPDLDALVKQPLQEEELKTATEKMRDIIRRRQTFDTRTEEENQSLASNDARLMLTSLTLNTEGLSDKSRRILWAKCYIVTRSTRYVQAACELGLKNVVSTTPQHLIALIEKRTGPVASDTELVQLLENPLVTHVVNGMWPDLERLLANGIALIGKSLVRLRCELDSTLHEQLAAVEEQDRLTGEEAESGLEAGSDYVELVASAERLGYVVHPLAKHARDVFSAQDAQGQRIRELEERIAEFDEVIKEFGKKKQRYLRRMARRYGTR